jgi:hypothetical protein
VHVLQNDPCTVRLKEALILEQMLDARACAAITLDLRSELAKYGALSNVELVTASNESTDKSRPGHADVLLKFSTAADAQHASAALEGRRLCGRPLTAVLEAI